MKNEAYIMGITLLMMGSVGFAYAGHEGSTFTYNEGYGPEQIKECQFSAYIEKSWIFFTERSPWVSGWITDCDSSNFWEKNRLFVRILDINGDLVEDTWQPHATKADPLVMPSLYEFTESVYRGGSYTGNANVERVELVHIAPNQYFFYMPQVNSIDFEHRGIYQIELTYGDHVRTIWFASLDPQIPWNVDKVPEEDPCNNYKNKLDLLENTRLALERQIDRYEGLGQKEKLQATIALLDENREEIESLEKCQE